MKPEIIAQAIYQLSNESKTDSAKLIKRTVNVLKKRGMIKLLPFVLSELKRLFYKDSKHQPKLLLASKKFEKDAKLALGDKIAKINPKIDENLIGGYIIEKGDVLLDRSYKRQLFEMFRQIKSNN